MEAVLRRAWDGEAVPQARWVRVALRGRARGITFAVAAPLAGAAHAPAAPGPTPRLWEHEVVELFLLGADGRYLEVEVGPFGNHLVLELARRREIVREGLALEWSARVTSDREGRRWSGRGFIPAALLPVGPLRYNVYAIQPEEAGRVHLALFPPGGEVPDFHRLESFRPVDFYDEYLADPLAARVGRA